MKHKICNFIFWTIKTLYFYLYIYSLFSASLATFCLTARTQVLEYRKIRVDSRDCFIVEPLEPLFSVITPQSMSKRDQTPSNKPQNLFTRHSSRLCGPATRCKEQFLGYRLKSCTSRRTGSVFLFVTRLWYDREYTFLRSKESKP